MGVDAVLLEADGTQVRGLPDPAGGTFDAAGDFDRLLVAEPMDGLPVWSCIDPNGDVELSPEAAKRLVAEVATLLAAARRGPEQNGLRRLSALAQECARRPTLVLRFRGD